MQPFFFRVTSGWARGARGDGAEDDGSAAQRPLNSEGGVPHGVLKNSEVAPCPKAYIVSRGRHPSPPPLSEIHPCRAGDGDQMRTCQWFSREVIEVPNPGLRGDFQKADPVRISTAWCSHKHSPCGKGNRLGGQAMECQGRSMQCMIPEQLRADIEL